MMRYIVVLPLIAACGLIQGCSICAAPTGADVIVGKDVCHLEPYPLGGGACYVPHKVIDISETNGVMMVTLKDKKGTHRVPGVSVLDGHLLPGFTLIEWTNPASLWKRDFGPDCIAPPDPPAERVPATQKVGG